MKRLTRTFTAALVMMACAVGTASAQQLRVGLQEDPDVLDPHRARTYVGRIVFTSMCDKLVDLSPKLEIVPQLALSWQWNDDSTVLTFKLRDDVTFHDGTHFDAAAARANLQRAMTLPDSFRKTELSSVKTIEAPDATTLVLTLKQPDATLLSQLTDRAGMMLSPQSFAGDDVNAVGRNPVCSGPYKFVERVQNDRIVLEKFDKYYDAKAFHFSRLVYLPIPDTTVRLSNLRAGGLDILERLNPADVGEVKKDGTLTLSNIAGLGYQELLFNHQNGERAKTNPFNDARVRRALDLSIDRDAINEVVGGGIFQPAGQAFPPASPFFEKKFGPRKRDVQAARALLKEAGKSEVKAELVFGNNTTTAAIAEMIQAMASESGIQLSLRPTDYAAMLSQMRGGNFEVAMRGWSGRSDPDGNVYQFLTCKGSQNDGRYCNPEVDKLFDEARTVPEVERRKALYEKAQALLHQDAADVYLYYQPWPFAMQKKVQGFIPYPDGMIRLKNVTFATK